MKNNKPVVGIVGGSSFIASSLAKHFIRHGYKVKIMDKKDPTKDLREYVEYVCCDIREYDIYRSISCP